jgi:nitroreductase
MHTLGIINQRISANKFAPDTSLSHTVIEELVACATQAPSSFNQQHWRFVAITEPQDKERLKAVAYGQQKVIDAAVTFIVLGDLLAHTKLAETLGRSVKAGIIDQAVVDGMVGMAGQMYANPAAQRDEAIRSASLAAMTLMLAAEAKGLVSGPMIGFDPEGVRDGRVQFRVVQPGEVVGAGARVLQLADLTDVYMTFFLPETVAGRVALGSEVRIVLDAAPNFVIPASVSFVASTAQFTPKTVETASERQKLMFRVRAQIPKELLVRHREQVKTGLPGVAWLRIDPNAMAPATGCEGQPANRSPQGRAVTAPVVTLRGVSQRYGATVALEASTWKCLRPHGGSDRAGWRGQIQPAFALVAGAHKVQAGKVETLGGDMASARHRRAVCSRIAYMPQGLGKNLYLTLSIEENLQFFGRLFGHDRAECRRRIDELTTRTGLRPFLTARWVSYPAA